MSRKQAAPYLHEIDIVRLLTFASVIGVHAVAQSATGDNVTANGVQVILHFTRDAFFALTGFILFYTNYQHPLDLKQFWKRRFPVVLIPYLVWSTIYFAMWANNQHGLTPATAAKRFGYDLLTGSGQYHLYFLLVSMQIYALFPFFRWVVQKTAGHHWALFVSLLTIDGLFVGWLHYGIHGGALRVFGLHAQEMVITYLVFIFGGAVAAVHLSAFRSWLAAHVRIAYGGLIIALLVAEAVYTINRHHNQSADFSAEPLQPAITISSIAIILGLYLLGMQWAARRKEGKVAAVVSEAAHASFGVYLVHPLFLTLAANLGFRWSAHIVPTAVSALISWCIAVALSAAFVEILIRTPLSMPLTGRVRR